MIKIQRRGKDSIMLRCGEHEVGVERREERTEKLTNKKPLSTAIASQWVGFQKIVEKE